MVRWWLITGMIGICSLWLGVSRGVAQPSSVRDSFDPAPNPLVTPSPAENPIRLTSNPNGSLTQSPGTPPPGSPLPPAASPPPGSAPPFSSPATPNGPPPLDPPPGETLTQPMWAAPGTPPGGALPPGVMGLPTRFPSKKQYRFSLDYQFLANSTLDGTNSDFGASSLQFTYDWKKPVLEDRSLILGLRPGFEILFLRGPNGNGPIMPSQLYGLTLNLNAMYRINDHSRVIATVTPGLYTDFENITSKALRFPAGVIYSYDWSETLTLSGGLIYTGQTETPFVPALGATWRPTPEWDLELVFPRPRAVYHFSDELDLYGTFRFNASAFEIDTPFGSELFQYRDLRFGAGLDYFTKTQQKINLEMGISFDRSIQFDRQLDYDIKPTFYLNLGGKF
ncbi:DUF6268 family outer membrane beta-barrel protein [Tuwongella immobilis]|uniref:Signal peptide protein: Uncharacterized protein n=1 Tax=Tuwongella immobilis TaxID=692036 RepID=A0A6C2YTT6_9BACT|nr:DUF6268 family outer membrane beta-barrel protein [Tuwongella immobilis]VIP04767.1 signal peptide protein : Uncharacterized protein OS=Isosphaera pallida (strain ATCC 43644 / DSM 9630 / IS1B) GN=Isop_2756 PE=4 SV=1 [Tuwongella immobilis]VTS06893.1 signal peptide protein : Uncharacterized protein OS=Isosphaera pallida (strain ATCC 43644 / DSM 9630 / IS1B) GN=Isop_2756 PE=4 SV=1 [Tuwongella immobilis]